MTNPVIDIAKEDLVNLLDAFIHQRPGLEFANYGDVTAYRAEVRGITKDLRHARVLLHYVARRDSISAADIQDAMVSAFSGRLQLARNSKGRVYVDYCTGQYWPTEYRRAVAAVLVACVWHRFRLDSPTPTAGGIYATAKREFSADIARRWFR